MIKKNKIKNKFTRSIMRIFLTSSIIGLLVGGFFSFNLMGEKEKMFKMNKFEFSQIDISKASRLIGSIGKGEENEKREDVYNEVIEWFMYKDTYKKIGEDLRIEITDQEVLNFIKEIEDFKDENNEFSPLKYENYLKVNVVDAEFYENLVKDELLINKLKTVINEQPFKMNDAKQIIEKLNKEFDVSIVIADTTKMADFLSDSEIKKFLLNNKNYMNIELDVNEVKHNENLTLGEFNVLKNKKSSIKDLIENNNHINKKMNISKTIELTDNVIIKDKTYSYKDKNSFFVFSFVNPEKSILEIDNIKRAFQFSKKIEFLNSYFENMFESKKTIQEISDSQDYFEKRQENINFNSDFINTDTIQSILKSKVGDIFYSETEPFYLVIKINEIKYKDVVKTSDFEEYYKQNMNILFLNILDKAAEKNY